MAILTTTDQGLNFTGGASFIKTGTSTVMSFTTSGNVGVGTDNPSRTLHVLGGDGGSGTHIAHFEGRSGVVGMYVRGDGRVGIGTTSPTASLHINKSTPSITLETTANSNDPIINLKSNGAITGEGAQMWYDNSIGSLHIQTTYPNNAADIVFHTATGADKSTGNVRMVIGGDGNVGIGTTSPAQPLHVLNDSSANVHAKIRVQGGSTSGYADLGVQSNYVRLLVNDVQTTAYSGAVQYNYINGNVATTLTSTGLGISTTNPQAALHVAGSIGNSPTGDGVLMGLNNNYGHIQLNGSTGSYIDFSSSGVDRKGRILYNNAGNYMQIQTNGSDKVRITSSGNVGIGTTSPDSKLDVTGGNITVNTSGITFADFKYGSIGSETSRGTITTDGIDLRINATADLVLLPTGNVGIGTVNPTARLHLEGDSIIEGVIRGDNVNLGSGGAIKIKASNSASDQYVAFGTTPSGSSGSATFTEKMRIDSAGNVGIGTTSPSQKLEVGTDTDVSAQIGKAHVGYIGFADHAGFSHLDKANSSSYALLQSHVGDTFINSAASRHIYFRKGNTTIGGFNNSSDFYVDTDSLYVDASADRVGIGTNAPTDTLDVDGGIRLSTSGRIQGRSYPYTTNIGSGANATTTNITAGSTDKSEISLVGGDVGDRIEFKTNSTERMRIDASGNVGIGTTSPNAESNRVSLELNATWGGVIQNSVSGTPKSEWRWSTGGSTVFGAVANEPLDLTTNNATRVRIDASGNVGIGTNNPKTALAFGGFGSIWVNNDSNNPFGIDTVGGELRLFTGSHASYQMKLGQYNGTTFNSYLTIGDGSSNGNYVGIGTTSPFTNLEVAGSGLDSIIRLYAGGGTANIRTWEMRAVGVAGEGLLFRQVNDANNSYTNRMIIDTDGNVGIGTITPDSKLHIDSTGEALRFTRSSQETYRLIHGTSGLYFTRPNSASLAFGVTQNSDFDIFDTSANVMFRADASTGNVGIGTTSPSSNLTIVTPAPNFNDGENAVRLEYHGSGGASPAAIGAGIVFAQRWWTGDTSLARTGGIYGVKNNGSGGYGGGLAFYTQPNSAADMAQHMTINSTGKVGIGTTSPQRKLHVGTVVLGGSSDANADIVSTGGITLNSSYRLSFDHAYYVHGNIRYTNSGTSEAKLEYQGYYGHKFITRSGTSSMVIKGDTGNVGIGINGPRQKLDVQGRVYVEHQGVNWNVTTPGTSVGTIHLDPVGDGANNTGNALTFGASDSSSGGTAQAGIYIRSDGSYGTKMYLATTNSYASGSKTRLAIDHNGNVGIGVTNPSYKLHVGGSIVGTSKNFIIDHPTKEGKKLLHGCIEGPEAAVYFRGKSTSNIIEMPDYWIGLVDIDTMTVDITPWGPNQDIYVESIADDGEITIAANTEEPLNYFYVVYGERKDIDKLEIEIVDPEYSD